MSVKIIIGSQSVLSEQLSITKTIDSLCDTFDLSLPNISCDFTKKVQILINDTPIMVGYIDQVNHATPANNNTISLSGRSMSQDIVDSRITFSAKRKTLSEIATELFKRFDQNFNTDTKTKAVPDFTIVAESAFEALSQLAKQQNLIFIENSDGSVSLVKPADVDKTHIKLDATNLSSFNISEQLSKFFNTTTVKTNPSFNNLEPDTHNDNAYSLVIDRVRKNRVIEIIADKLDNLGACRDRATELINQAKADSIVASGTSNSWLDPLGKLWSVNSLYTVNNERMLLSTATFNQSGSDRTTQLNFKGYYQKPIFKKTLPNKPYHYYCPKIVKDEGGYSNNPDDKGGETYKGVTTHTFKKYAKKEGIEPSKENHQSLTDKQVCGIFKEYWDIVRADEFQDSELAYQVADFAFHSGPNNAVRTLQQVLVKMGSSITIDKNLGSDTLNAIHQHDSSILYQNLRKARIEYLYNLVKADPTQQVHLNGWINRAKDFNYY